MFSSTGRIRRRLKIVHPKRTKITLVLPARSSAKLPLKSRKTIAELADLFGEITQKLKKPKLKYQDKRYLEESKLAILSALKTHLSVTARIPQLPKEEIIQPETHRYARRALFGFSLAISLCLDGMGCFLYGEKLFALIPFLSNPVLIVGGVLFAIANFIIFYSWEAIILRDKLGIKDSGKKLRSLIALETGYMQELKEINVLVDHQRVVNQMGMNEYRQLIQLTSLMNQDILSKREDKKPEPESFSKKIFRYSVLSFGTVMVAGGGYFMSSAILLLFAAALLSNPIGWMIMGAAVAVSLIFFFAVRASGLMKFVNPDIDAFQQNKKALEDFPLRDEAHLNESILEKSARHKSHALRFKQKPQFSATNECDQDDCNQELISNNRLRTGV